jgi:hypothetical protein
MPDGANKGAFVQAYNAQIAVDAEAQIIVAAISPRTPMTSASSFRWRKPSCKTSGTRHHHVGGRGLLQRPQHRA